MIQDRSIGGGRYDDLTSVFGLKDVSEWGYHLESTEYIL